MEDRMLGVCEKTAKCPLFQGEMLASKKAQEIYMRLYCTGGLAGKKQCKRYQVSQLLKGPVPKDIMPNDVRTAEEIVEAIRNAENDTFLK